MKSKAGAVMKAAEKARRAEQRVSNARKELVRAEKVAIPRASLAHVRHWRMICP